MTSSDILKAAGPVVDAFESLGISYYIGGSVASSAYGMPRSTLNVDLVANLRQNDLDPFIRVLGKAYYIDRDLGLQAIEKKTSFNLMHLRTMLKLDVFIKKNSDYDNQAFKRRRLERLEEPEGAWSFYLASAEDVLLHKLTWYRLGGEVSERQWGDVLGIIRVQNHNLDLNYLEQWAAVLGVAELLARALQTAENYIHYT